MASTLPLVTKSVPSWILLVLLSFSVDFSGLLLTRRYRSANVGGSLRQKRVAAVVQLKTTDGSGAV